jgi:rubrerythrin
MRNAFASLAALALLLSPLAATAHEGHDHITGTVTKVQADRIEVKAMGGASHDVALTKATVYKKGKAAATKADVKPGVRVVVDATETKGGLEAKEIRMSVEDKAVYTCPMHPEVQKPEPGKCPKCGMNLEKKPA